MERRTTNEKSPKTQNKASKPPTTYEIPPITDDDRNLIPASPDIFTPKTKKRKGGKKVKFSRAKKSIGGFITEEP